MDESEELESDYERSEALVELDSQVEEVCDVWQVQGDWETFQVRDVPAVELRYNRDKSGATKQFFKDNGMTTGEKNDREVNNFSRQQCQQNLSSSVPSPTCRRCRSSAPTPPSSCPGSPG